jgi:four helix bundle protein
MELARDVCLRLVPALPEEEKYALASQLRRAAQSIPANIAEAYGRFHYADAARCCYIARGSLEEMWSHVLLGREIGYWRDFSFEDLRKRYLRVQQMLNGYIGYLKRSRRT